MNYEVKLSDIIYYQLQCGNITMYQAMQLYAERPDIKKNEEKCIKILKSFIDDKILE